MSRNHDLLPSPLAHGITDLLRSPGVKPTFAKDQRDAQRPADLGSAPVSSHDQTSERDARTAAPAIADRLQSGHLPEFSHVRVHTDDRASAAATALDARAFTFGSHIIFGKNQYTPEWSQGRHLLAHELAHVAQNRDGAAPTIARDEGDPTATKANPPAVSTGSGTAAAPAVAPKSVTGYETKGSSVDKDDLDKVAGENYWDQKVLAKIDVVNFNTVSSRFTADAEEHNAVMSVLWQKKPPTGFTAKQVVTVSIPPRVGAKTSKALLYEFTFIPGSNKTKPKVEVRFKAEDAAARADQAPEPVTGYTPPARTMKDSGFPEGADKYFKDHPAEFNQLSSWIDSAPGPKFDRIVTTSEVGKRNKKHNSSYQVSGTKDQQGSIQSLKVDLLSETPTYIETPPAGYSTKDFGDLGIDELQARAKDKLGKVSGLDATPADERLSVKFAIQGYFKNGTRNSEVDALVTIANKPDKVLYTLRFRPGNNDVDVERIGEPGKTPQLTTTALNIGRVHGFSANSKDATTFKAWVNKRYPGVTVNGTTLEEMQKSVNDAMKTDAGTEDWFKKNYGMEVLSAADAATRLKTTHKRNSALTADTKTFTAEELRRFEFALENMSDPILAIVKGTKLARQQTHLVLKGRTVTPDAKTTGFTLQDGSEKTIIIYDNVTMNDDTMFGGGTRGIREASVMTHSHEFGHVLETSLRKPFDDFVKAKKIKPITWYAASTPVTESFPEAFAVYQNDPEWMQTNLPELFNWMEDVSKTGKAPKP